MKENLVWILIQCLVLLNDVLPAIDSILDQKAVDTWEIQLVNQNRWINNVQKWWIAKVTGEGLFAKVFLSVSKGGKLVWCWDTLKSWTGNLGLELSINLSNVRNLLVLLELIRKVLHSILCNRIAFIVVFVEFHSLITLIKHLYRKVTADCWNALKCFETLKRKHANFIIK